MNEYERENTSLERAGDLHLADGIVSFNLFFSHAQSEILQLPSFPLFLRLLLPNGLSERRGLG